MPRPAYTTLLKERVGAEKAAELMGVQKTYVNKVTKHQTSVRLTFELLAKAMIEKLDQDEHSTTDASVYVANLTEEQAEKYMDAAKLLQLPALKKI